MSESEPMRDAVRIIAEAGVNHNGSQAMARDLIDAAADAGADAVKFQTFRTADLMTRAAPKAVYQKAATEGDSQFDMIAALELSVDDHRALIAHARKRGIVFMSTPFDHASLDFLIDDLGVGELKLPSGEVTNGPLLLHAAEKRVPLILSTGMATMDEIADALAVIAFGLVGEGAPSLQAFAAAFDSIAGQVALRESVTLLHCTTEYPAPLHSVNLRAMDTMAEHFVLPVGYSDHTDGITVAVAAAARGARVIEKHLTLDRSLPGPDHQASADPATFAEMVKAVRAVEMALGEETKQPSDVELPNMAVARRSLVAKAAIKAGETFSTDNLTAKRPGDGLSPMTYWECLGRTASTDYDVDDLISPGEMD